MSNLAIRAELEQRLAAWAAAQVPPVPVTFESTPFTKPADGVFLECFLMPALTLNRGVSGDHATYYGLFQVNVWARSGRGMGQAERLSSNIISLFPVVPKTGNVSIEQLPRAEPSMADPSGWIVIPHVINYRYET
jgi:hypothetical protein